MQRLALVVVLLVVVGGCHQDNPESCEIPSNAGNGMCPGIDAAIDAPPPTPECTTSTPCANPDKGVCDTTINGGTCVQCTATSAMACKDTTPACINNVCVPCTRHADCVDSNVCMPDGTCANPDDVAYLDGGGTDQMTCTKAMPCTNIEKAAMAKSILKISGTLTERATLNGRDVLILADPTAKLAPTRDGAALEIRDSKVQIYDLEISHMPSANVRDGIFVNDDQAQVELTRVTITNNTGDGARVNAGHLTCTRCTITLNTLRGINLASGEITISRSVIQGNNGGGILIGVNGIFQIVANFIYGNGSSSSPTGGINAPTLDGNSTNRIDFNSISHNSASGFAGISCSSTMQLTAKYNVIWKNGTMDQVNPGGCQHVSSDIGPLPASPTLTNFNLDPGFQNEASGDLHLKLDSPVRKLAQPLATDVTGIAANDFDGDARMSVPMVDLGADQTPP